MDDIKLNCGRVGMTDISHILTAVVIWRNKVSQQRRHASMKILKYQKYAFLMMMENSSAY